MNSIVDLLADAGGAGKKSNPLGSFALGEVAENGNKKYPGMVKVEFTGWERGENISKWLPVLYGYAGKDYGAYLVPEVGDVVLVGFIGSSMDKPFVLGSFHPADGTIQGEAFEAKNRRRYLKTKGGVELDIQDGDDKQKASVTTPKGMNITLDDGGETIKVTDKDGNNAVELDCKGGNIDIKADKKITLTAGECTITLDGSGNKIEIKAGTINIEAQQTGTLKASSNLTVEGGMLTCEGKQTVTLKGASMAEISGGMVKIN